MKQSDFDWKSGMVKSWGLGEFDLGANLADQSHLLKEDLMQVNFGKHLVLDLGWLPEFNLNGQFNLSVIKDEDWVNPLYQIQFCDIAQFVRNLENAIKIAHASLE